MDLGDSILSYLIVYLCINLFCMMKSTYVFFYAWSCIFYFSCNQVKQEQTVSNDKKTTGFELMNSSHTNIHFSNTLTEDNQYNYLNYEAIYNGAGVAILDVNNDGLQDLFFVSNQDKEKLYLNKGDFKFDDISESAGIQGADEWTAGVCVADVNGDGYDDIYVCCHLLENEEKRGNKLYINNKNNTFTEQASQFGIDDKGYSIHANFFDYDLDGDLDLLVANQPPNNNKTRQEILKPEYIYSNHFYKNNGNNTFTDVTNESGLFQVGYCLSTSVGDISNDGYPDIYVANDYNVPDAVYLNLRNGTFQNITANALNHMSNFSMGCDMSDMNNDGWLDIFVADMVSENRYRNKVNMSGMNPAQFWKFVNLGFQYQYMFNTLQLNQGNGHFSEIAQMLGMSKTDWSWSAFFSDFDNDGWKDLYITNGLMRDVRNKDFDHLRSEFLKNKNNPSYQGERFNSAVELLNKAPSVKISNYMFQNKGSLNFENKTSAWKLNDPSFSQGAAFGDLDNDGNIDLVVNNMNDPAFIYRNTNTDGHFIRFKLKGEKLNTRSFGARAVIYINGNMQVQELTNVRGYMSTSEPYLHFGVGNSQIIDSVIVRWPSGKIITKLKVKTNQLLELNEADALESRGQFLETNSLQYTQEVNSESLNRISHIQNNYDDFKREILIPHKMSTLGPCLAIADVNSDGLEDFYLGGSAGFSGQLYLQGNDGNFLLQTSGPWQAFKGSEDADALFFDADQDGDLDLIVCSGSNVFSENSPLYNDRLFINNGKGQYTDGSKKLPKLSTSKGLVKAFDVDGDKDLDLFLGGRQIPGKYGLSVQSFILINDNGTFIDKTKELCPVLCSDFGNVSCGSWLDIDSDSDQDLVLGGEWMNIKILENNGHGYFSDQSVKWKTDSTFGWWNSIVATDIDADGDLDLLAGNLGLNSKFKTSKEKPFSIYLNDFDQNGTWDSYLGAYDADGKIYPVRGRQCSSEQMPFIKEKFSNYESFAKATLDNILEGKMDHTVVKRVNEFKNGFFINEGKNGFKFKPFPMEAQIAPIYDFVVYDFNNDGKMDLAYGGNYFNREVETTRSDAGIGGILLGDGKLNFVPVHSSLTGLKLNRDLRKMKLIKVGNKDCILSANNNSPIQLNMIK